MTFTRGDYCGRVAVTNNNNNILCSGSSAGLSTISVSYRSAVRALSEHLPCTPWIPDLSLYLSNRQVSDWVQSKDFPFLAFAPYVTGPDLEALSEHSPCMLWARDQIPQTDPDPTGFIANMASAQTGAQTQTPIACEASSHFGTRNQEMLLTELASAQYAFGANAQTEGRNRDPFLTGQVRVLRDSKPGTDAYVASAQTGDGTLNPVANKASAQTGAKSRDP
ncbi:hypothetical protein DPMN_019529 [Dreissena polymorpha]|uniref:Uncharacterized protein n=1 Tax=Dreissena polymorpha TaxID=45954 RepID=A0A9D4S9D2_DREPO|nr:hypothetical protein DPMN_019529 [Dreissena polymorpha]